MNFTIVSGAPTGNQVVSGGTTWYQWQWTIIVGGQERTFYEWVDTEDPADEPGLEQEIEDNGLGNLTEDRDKMPPPDEPGTGPIVADNDGTPDDGEEDDDGEDDDEGDDGDEGPPLGDSV